MTARIQYPQPKVSAPPTSATVFGFIVAGSYQSSGENSPAAPASKINTVRMGRV